MFYDPTPIGLDYNEIAERANQLPRPLFLGGSRLVVHIQTSESAVDDFLALINELAEEKKRAGFMKPNLPTEQKVHKDIYVRRTAKATN